LGDSVDIGVGTIRPGRGTSTSWDGGRPETPCSAARAPADLAADFPLSGPGHTGRVVPDGVQDEPFTVLVVCTGNICRSALAERLARAYLNEALGPDAGRVLVRSAGTQAVVGSGVHPDSALVLAGLGGDPAGFAARQLVDEMAVDADLTLALTRAHRRAVLNVAPRALSRTFTLREAAELVHLLNPVDEPVGNTFAERCRALVRAMAAARSKRPSESSDDIADPIGRPVEFHEQVGEEIASTLLPLLGRLVSLRDPAGPVMLSVADCDAYLGQ
jgi:protein-tyrosine-phosphatase